MTLLAGHILVLSRRPNIRTYHSIHARQSPRPPQWTLHRTGCPTVNRLATRIPAPTTTRPGTLTCRTCKPHTEKDPKKP